MQLLSFQLNLVNKFRVASSEPAVLIAVCLVQRLCDARGSPVEIPQPDVSSPSLRDAAGRRLQFFFTDLTSFLVGRFDMLAVFGEGRECLLSCVGVVLCISDLWFSLDENRIVPV